MTLEQRDLSLMFDVEVWRDQLKVRQELSLTQSPHLRIVHILQIVKIEEGE